MKVTHIYGKTFKWRVSQLSSAAHSHFSEILSTKTMVRMAGCQLQLPHGPGQKVLCNVWMCQCSENSLVLTWMFQTWVSGYYGSLYGSTIVLNHPQTFSINIQMSIQGDSLTFQTISSYWLLAYIQHLRYLRGSIHVERRGSAKVLRWKEAWPVLEAVESLV